MATGQNKAPSFFNFLKEGFLLPSRNRRLFTAAFTLILVSTALLALGNDLSVKPVVKPLTDEINLDIKALNTTQPGSPDFKKVLREIQNDTKELLLISVGYFVFSVVVNAAVRIAILFAAVSTYSGEKPTTTFATLLRQAKAQIKGPLLTLAFVYVLETVTFVLLTVMASLLGILMAMKYFVALFVASLLVIAASVYLVYFSFLCSFSVVVAVAEPGCHGPAALGKAWRLAKGKKWQVALYVAITSALAYAVSPVRTLSKTWAINSTALGLLLGFVCAVLQALVQLFSLCAMTAFYYERREIIDTQLWATGYAKLSTEEANA
jgi:hypothetical protein